MNYNNLTESDEEVLRQQLHALNETSKKSEKKDGLATEHERKVTLVALRVVRLQSYLAELRTRRRTDLLVLNPMADADIAKAESELSQYKRALKNLVREKSLSDEGMSL